MIKFPKINLSVQILLIFIGILFFGQHLNPQLKSILFGISTILNQILTLALPFIVFSCLFSCIVSQQSQAAKFILRILALVVLSNLLSIIYTYGISHIAFRQAFFTLEQAKPHKVIGLLPYFGKLKIKSWFTSNIGLSLALVLGIIGAKYDQIHLKKLAKYSDKLTQFFLAKLFIPVLPLFAAGFIVKMEHDGVLRQVTESYLPIIILVLSASILYISSMFLVLAKGNLQQTWQYIKTSAPSAFLGFSTMSSLAAMPALIKSASFNTKDPKLAQAVVPATINMHMIGDSIAIPIFAMSLLLSTGAKLPSFVQYLQFTQFFILYKFAVAAIPGGSILIFIPILRQYLGLNEELIGMITPMYMLFDPIITGINVLGNNAFAVLVSKFMPKTSKA